MVVGFACRHWLKFDRVADYSNQGEFYCTDFKVFAGEFVRTLQNSITRSTCDDQRLLPGSISRVPDKTPCELPREKEIRGEYRKSCSWYDQRFACLY